MVFNAFSCFFNRNLVKLGTQLLFTTANVHEALRMVTEHKPDLIILDVMMPGISGLEVCRKLKKYPKTGSIKIIMISARGQLKEQEEGIKAGADRYISKPFDYEELIRTIEDIGGMKIKYSLQRTQRAWR